MRKLNGSKQKMLFNKFDYLALGQTAKMKG